MPKSWLIGIVCFVAFIILLIVNPFVMIRAGERGIVLHWGAVEDKILGEGIYWITPIAKNIKKLDVKTQKEEVDVSAASKDLQIVTSKIALNYHLEEEKVNRLWQKIGEDYKERIIAPAIQEAMKATTAKYTAEELITKREVVKETAKLSLKDRLTDKFVVMDELSIINFDFSEEFNDAIEAKQTAVQQALKAENDLKRIKFEAEQRLAQAEAEAKAIKLQSDAAQNEKYVSLKQLEVQLEFAKQWNGVLPINLYGSAPIPFLQVGK